MAATMRDVAAAAGVSVKTVSRVVNREPHIRPEVISRVHAAIDELGWVPNDQARALRTGRTGVIGIGVAELRRPYLASLVEALVSEADRRGLRAAVEPTHDEPRRLQALLDARGSAFDGLVLIRPRPDARPNLSGRPVVVVQGGESFDRVDAVDDDVVEASALIARHLTVMGRGHPVLLGQDRGRLPGQPDRSSDILRAAFATAGLDHDLPVVPLEGRPDRRAGARAVARLLEPGRPELARADALVCSNDEVALGALAALAERGIDVPGRLAVIGYDNLNDGFFSQPSLTTIDPGTDRIARAALDLMTDRLAGNGNGAPHRVVTPVELVRRESTLGVAAR